MNRWADRCPCWACRRARLGSFRAARCNASRADKCTTGRARRGPMRCTVRSCGATWRPAGWGPGAFLFPTKRMCGWPPAPQSRHPRPARAKAASNGRTPRFSGARPPGCTRCRAQSEMPISPPAGRGHRTTVSSTDWACPSPTRSTGPPGPASAASTGSSMAASSGRAAGAGLPGLPDQARPRPDRGRRGYRSRSERSVLPHQPYPGRQDRVSERIPNRGSFGGDNSHDLDLLINHLIVPNDPELRVELSVEVWDEDDSSGDDHLGTLTKELNIANAWGLFDNDKGIFVATGLGEVRNSNGRRSRASRPRQRRTSGTPETGNGHTDLSSVRGRVHRHRRRPGIYRSLPTGHSAKSSRDCQTDRLQRQLFGFCTEALYAWFGHGMGLPLARFLPGDWEASATPSTSSISFRSAATCWRIPTTRRRTT